MSILGSPTGRSSDKMSYHRVEGQQDASPRTQARDTVGLDFIQ